MILRNFDRYETMIDSSNFPTEHVLNVNMELSINETQIELHQKRKEGETALRDILMKELGLKNQTFAEFTSQELLTFKESIKKYFPKENRLEAIKKQSKEHNNQYQNTNVLVDTAIFNFMTFSQVFKDERLIIDNLFNLSRVISESYSSIKLHLLGEAMFIAAEKTNYDPKTLNLLVYICYLMRNDDRAFQYTNLVLASILGKQRIEKNLVVNKLNPKPWHGEISDLILIDSDCAFICGNHELRLFDPAIYVSIDGNFTNCLELRDHGIILYQTKIGENKVLKQLYNPFNLNTIGSQETIELDFKIESIAFGQCLIVAGEGKRKDIFGEGPEELAPGTKYVGKKRLGNFEIINKEKIVKYADFVGRPDWLKEVQVSPEGNMSFDYRFLTVSDVLKEEGCDILPLVLKNIVDNVNSFDIIDTVTARAFVRLITIREEKMKPALFAALRAMIEQTEEIDGRTKEILQKGLSDMPEGREILHFLLGIECDVSHLSVEDKVNKEYQLSVEELCNCEMDTPFIFREAARLSGTLQLKEAKNFRVSLIDLLMSNEGKLDDLVEIYLSNQTKLNLGKEIFIQSAISKSETIEFDSLGETKFYSNFKKYNCSETTKVVINGEDCSKYALNKSEINKVCFNYNYSEIAYLLLSEEKFKISREQFTSFSALHSLMSRIESSLHTPNLDKDVEKIVHSRLLRIVNLSKETQDLGLDFHNLSEPLENRKFIGGNAEKTKLITRIVNMLFVALLKHQRLLEDFAKGNQVELFKKLFTRFEQLRQWLFLRKGMFICDNPAETEAKVQSDLEAFEKRAVFLLDTVCPEETIDRDINKIEPVIFEILFVFKSSKIEIATINSAIEEGNKRIDDLIKEINILIRVFAKSENTRAFSYLFVNILKKGIDFSFYRELGAIDSRNYGKLEEASLELSNQIFERLLSTECVTEKCGLIKCLFSTYSTAELVHFAKQNYFHRIFDMIQTGENTDKLIYGSVFDSHRLKKDVTNLMRFFIIQMCDKTEKKDFSSEFELQKKQTLLSIDQSSLVTSTLQELASRDSKLVETLLDLGVKYDNIIEFTEQIKTEEKLSEIVRLTSILIYSLSKVDAKQFKPIISDLLKTKVIPFNLKSELTALIGKSVKYGLKKGDKFIVGKEVKEFSHFKKDGKIADYPVGLVVDKNNQEFSRNDIDLTSIYFDPKTDFTDSLPFEAYWKQAAAGEKWHLFAEDKTVSLMNDITFMQISVDKEIKQGWDKGRFTLQDGVLKFEGKSTYLFSSEESEKLTKVNYGLDELKSYFKDKKIENIKERVEKSASLRGHLFYRRGSVKNIMENVVREQELLGDRKCILDKLVTNYLKNRSISEVVHFLDVIADSDFEEVLNSLDFSCLDKEEKMKLLCQYVSKTSNLRNRVIAEKLLPIVKEEDIVSQLVVDTAVEIDKEPCFTEIEHSFIEFARYSKIALEKADIKFLNSQLVRNAKDEDTLIINFNEENIIKLKNTQDKTAFEAHQTQGLLFEHGNTDSTKLTLIEVKIPNQEACISFDRVKLGEGILVFADSEGKQLIDVFTYFDKLKELNVIGDSVYVSLPLTGLKTNITRMNRDFNFKKHEKISGSHSVWDSFNGVLAYSNEKFMSNFDMFAGFEEGEFSEEYASVMNKMGKVKHFANNSSNAALINEDNQLYWLNSVGLENEENTQGICYEGPLDMTPYGEIVDIAVSEDNIMISNASGELFIHGQPIGNILTEITRKKFVKLERPPGRLVGLYCDSSSNFRGESVFFVIMEEKNRVIYSLAKNNSAGFPLAKNQLLPVNSLNKFRWLKHIDNSTLMFSFDGKPFVTGNKSRLNCELLFATSEEVQQINCNGRVVDASYYEVDGYSTAFIFGSSNENSIQLVRNGDSRSIELEGEVPLRLMGKDETLWIISLSKNTEFKRSELVPGDKKFTVYVSSSEESKGLSFLKEVSEEKLNSLAKINEEKGCLNPTECDSIIKLDSEQLYFLSNFLKSKNKRISELIMNSGKVSKKCIANFALMGEEARQALFNDYVEKMQSEKDTYTPDVHLNRKKAVELLNTGQPDTEDLSIFAQLRKKTEEHQFRWFNNEIFKVYLEGEGATDCGGPRREMFTQMSNELMSQVLDVMIPCPNYLGNYGDFRQTWVINPDPCEKTQGLLKFLGSMLANCIVSSSVLSIDLNPVVWKGLVSDEITREDIKLTDNYFYDILNNLEKSDVTEDLVFAVTEGKFKVNSIAGKEVIIKEGEVTLNNIKEYVEAAEAYKIQEIKDQAKYLFKGIE